MYQRIKPQDSFKIRHNIVLPTKVLSLRLRKHSSTCRLYIFWLLSTKIDPTAVQSRRPNNKLVGFFTKKLNMSNISQICQFQLICQCLIGEHSTMDRLSILVGRLIKSMAPTKYVFKVPQVGHFLPLVSDIGRLVEPQL